MTNKFIEQRVEALENELSELKLIVAQIRKPSTVVEDALANDFIDAQAEKLFEKQIIPKTPNQLRAEIIEKAKGFVEGNLSKNHPNACYDKLGAWLVSDGGQFAVTTEIDFIVNVNKRTIVALIRCASGGIRGRGIAKCDPTDVFNSHIGKAIALGRALGLDVSEFEQAVQPTEIVLGHAISSTRKNGEYYEYPEVTKVESGKVWGVDSIRGYNSCTPIKEFYTESATRPKIINDTNAQYGGIE